MANNPYINKVVYGGQTLIDLSSDTLASADQLGQGVVAHTRTGATITGTADTSSFVVTLSDNEDWDGESDDFLLKDKTYAEIKAAYDAGKIITISFYEYSAWYYDDWDDSFYFTALGDWTHGFGYYTFIASESDEWVYGWFHPFEEIILVYVGLYNGQWRPERSYQEIKTAMDNNQFPLVSSEDAGVTGYWDDDDSILVYRVYENVNGLIKDYSYTYAENDVVTLTDYHEYTTAPSGNIEITQQTGTNVSQYATASVRSGAILGPGISVRGYRTESGQRKWAINAAVETEAGWIPADEIEGIERVYNAVPSNTSVTPSTSSQTIGGANYMMEGAVTVNPIPSQYIVPTGNVNISQAGQTDVTNYATATVPSGTEGTPSASKGSVSNHSVTVTPSVTNASGWIDGGTHTGTGVSVSASELVSGTYTVDSSGTKDVTNYASASVPSGTAGTPTATKGSVSNHSVTVTPSVTNTTGYITGSTINGTAVSVSASELVSGSQTITENGTVDVTNLQQIVVQVEGGGSTGPQIDTIDAINASSSTLVFSGLKGEPIAFSVMIDNNVSTGSSQAAALVYDGTDVHAQTITSQVEYNSSFTQSYSNGTLTITASGATFQNTTYYLTYAYGGSASNVDTKDVQVGSGATSITFTGLDDEPIYWSCIFKSDFGTSSGYQRVIFVDFEGTDAGIFGMEMDSSAKNARHWTSSYNNGSLTITSNGTNQGGYFHQPGYYQLTAVYEDIEPQEIDVVPLSVTQNGTYTAPSGTAYSPVTVNVPSGGSTNIATTTWTNSSTSTVSHQFTGLSGTPKAAFLRSTTQLTRSSSNTYYYIADIVWDGSEARGNYHLRSSGAYTDVPASGTAKYNVTVGTDSITFSSTASSRSSAPGSFYNGTYELTYIY